MPMRTCANAASFLSHSGRVPPRRAGASEPPTDRFFGALGDFLSREDRARRPIDAAPIPAKLR
jgi:hypothetical protein